MTARKALADLMSRLHQGHIEHVEPARERIVACLDALDDIATRPILTFDCSLDGKLVEVVTLADVQDITKQAKDAIASDTDPVSADAPIVIATSEVARATDVANPDTQTVL